MPKQKRVSRILMERRAAQRARDENKRETLTAEGSWKELDFKFSHAKKDLITELHELEGHAVNIKEFGGLAIFHGFNGVPVRKPDHSIVWEGKLYYEPITEVPEGATPLTSLPGLGGSPASTATPKAKDIPKVVSNTPEVKS